MTCGPLRSTLLSYIRHQSKAGSVRVLKREGSSQEGSSGVGICTFLFNFTPQQCYEPDTIVLFIRKGNCSYRSLNNLCSDTSLVCQEL